MLWPGEDGVNLSRVPRIVLIASALFDERRTGGGDNVRERKRRKKVSRSSAHITKQPRSLPSGAAVVHQSAQPTRRSANFLRREEIEVEA
mmetsp:Transcript_126/g.240  ORF Transcript_126/g.240 Transcript_126/m.240 type:complete len:90 (-) Transcript_126:247-516(-)